MDAIHRYFDELAPHYDQARFNNSYGQFIDALERPILTRLLKDTHPAQNLDMACGTGRFLSFASTGLDISQTMLDIAASKYPHARLCRASFDDTPFPDQSFRTIYALHLLMHLNESRVHDLSQEARRLLTCDGRLIVDLPSHFRRRFKKRQSHWHGAYAPQISLFQSWGWEIVSIHPILMLPIHRIPDALRAACLFVERPLSRLLPPFFASYMIVEMKNSYERGS